MEFQKINGVTPNGNSFNLEALYRLLPACFTEKDVKGPDGVHHTERVINFDKLKSFLGEEYVAEEGDEVYDFTWVGKRAARADAAAPINKTLRPSPEESVNWDTTKNLYIEGDNLEALKLLQTSYMGKVKMIYIDPPYNTGNDFVYEDDFAISDADYQSESGQVDDEGNRYRRNLASEGRFHSKWCSMIYSRLLVARSLLTEDGVILISIDDNEVDNLKKICSEVFGEANFLATLIWNKQHSQQQGIFKRYHESVIVYAKNASIQSNISGGEGIIEAGAQKKISKANPASTFTFPAGVRFEAPDGTCLTGTYGDSEKSTIVEGRLLARDGKTAEAVTISAGWTQKNQMKDYFDGKEVIDSKGQKVLEFFFNSAGKIKCTKERSKITPPTLLPLYGMVSEQSDQLAELMGGTYFDTPKPVQMIKDFESWFVRDNEIVMDFFSGSATTAHSTMEVNGEDGVNRHFILVQWPEKTDPNSDAFRDGYENICEIGKERIRRAGRKVMEELKNRNDDGDIFNQDKNVPFIDTGFRVFKVADSYFEDVKKSPSEYSQENLDLFLDNIKPDTPDLDLLFGCMLQWGVELSLPLTSKEVAGCTIYNVNDGDLMACFAENVGNDVVDAIADHHPLRVVFRDGCFQDDAQKMNLIEQFKQRCGWSEEDAIKRIRVI